MEGIMHLADEEMGFTEEEAAERQPLLSNTKASDEVLDLGGTDIVQFSSFIYYADERTKTMDVDIIRLGSMRHRVAVKFFTADGSAKRSEQYEHTSHRVVFEEGEHTKSIAIPIIDDGLWSATKEFRICLCDQENCQLGLYLHQCRVKILNAEVFPSDEFKHDLEKGHDGIKSISDWALFFEYCQLNYHSANLQFDTWFVLVMDQMGSVFLFITLWVGVYLVDTVFARDESSAQHLLVHSRTHTAGIVALWFVVPHLLMGAWDSFKVYLDIQGASREYLQMSMMEQMLHYTSESRNKVTSGELSIKVTSSSEAVAKGYVAVLNIIGILGRIFAIEVFIIMYQADGLAIGSTVFIVLALAVFICFRVESARSTAEAVEAKLMMLDTLVEESFQRFELFGDYNKRGVMADIFSIAIGRFSKSKISDVLVHLVGQYATKLLSGAVIFIYILWKAPMVLSGTCSLGIFLATISIFSTYLADAMSNLNDQLMSIVDAFAPLKEFTSCLNFTLELAALKTASQYRRKQTIAYMDEIVARPRTDQGVDHDAVPIVTSDMSFEHSGGQAVLKAVNIEIRQGEIAGVVGSHGAGKSTLIRLLGGNLIPTTGTVFVPSHLRILHVSQEPVLIQASMLHNLALGLPDPANLSDEDRQRIMSILELLNMKHVIDIIDMEKCSAGVSDQDDDCAKEEIKFVTAEESVWEHSLHHSMKLKVHMARALIANPEVMVIDRTLQGLDEEESTKFHNILSKHVEEKGLCMPKEGQASRRPRTVIFSTEVISFAEWADTTLEVHAESHTVTQKRLRSSPTRTRVSRNSVVGWLDH